MMAPVAAVPDAAAPDKGPAYTREDNHDGSVVLKLAHPVRLDGEEVTRLTIPALTGRHMRACPWAFADRPTVGQLVTFAAGIVSPLGIVDELPAVIARDVGVEVMIALGKSLGIGAARSPS